MAENLTVARPYAKAAFDFAVEQNNLDKWQNFLEAMSIACSDRYYLDHLKLESNSKLAANSLISLLKDLVDENQINFINLIGENIDATWENLYTGGSRNGQEAPYCTWEELIEMHKSGNINLCSHSYGLHRYNRDGRIGAAMIDGESADDFAAVIRADYKKVSSSLTGWTDIIPRTLAYPYSKRSAEGDKVILENTTFEILMAGQGARGTEGNYFVRGTDFSSQLTLMSRPCRMEGTPISVYLDNITRKDGQNGVNTEKNHLTLSAAECKSIASAYFATISPIKFAK